jgi:hypothetical protein
MVWFAAIPLSLNPPPAAVALLIVIVAVPELVSVIACVLLLPANTLLKLKLSGFAAKVLPAAVALPVIVNVCGEFCALSVKRMLPLTPVADCGVNCTLNVVDAFGPIVAGIARPLILKPVPVTAAALTDKFMFPVLLSVTFWVLVWPMGTLLKFREVGENAGTASRPAPLSATVRVELVASLVTVKLPVAGVMDVGANWICTVAL